MRVDLAATVEAYGGYTALAKRMKLALATVHGWKLRESLPDWRADQIAAVVKKDGGLPRITVQTTIRQAKIAIKQAKARAAKKRKAR